MDRRIEEIFHAVADMSPEAREEYFLGQEIDPATRLKVSLLLEHDSDAPALALQNEVAAVAQRALGQLAPRATRCGRYQLRTLIGSGGMGSVYLADRVDGEVAQRVAVKLLRQNDTDERLPEGFLSERFLGERQILANLSHPNIAALLDAGRTEDGKPFLAMEYVEGTAIDAHAAEMSIGSKVRLFLKVCGAVAYLHRNLVVHRDIKPANILVTPAGEPKLLDFGIAKIVDLMGETGATRVPILTPGYASPEQVAGRTASTSMDIYSLGAVLYSMITGSSPHRFDDDSPHGILKTIATGQIVPPSKLLPAVRRDLEIVILKALRKNSEERYETVEQLSDDLENYLTGNPIGARAGDRLYRLRKLIRRRWLPIAAAALAFCGLSSGMLVANREKAEAQERFMEVRRLANRFVELHGDVAKLPGSTKIRERIVNTALNYLQNLSSTSGKDIQLLGEIGQVYGLVGQAQGLPGQPNLGRSEDALKSFRQAVEFERRAAEFDPKFLRDLAGLRSDLGYVALQQGYIGEARTNLTAAASMAEHLRSEDPDDMELVALSARTASNLGDLSETDGRMEEALGFFEKASKLHDEYLRLNPGSAARHAAYRAATLVASALADVKRYEEALSILRQRAPAIDSLLAEEPDNVAYLRSKMAAANYEGWIYDNESGDCLKRPRDAIAAYRRYVAMASRVAAADPDNAAARLSLASAYAKLSWPLAKVDSEQAVEAARKSVWLFEEDLSRAPRDRMLRSGLSKALQNLAYAYRRRHDTAEALISMQRSIIEKEALVREAPMDREEIKGLQSSRDLLEQIKAERKPPLTGK